MKKLVCGVGAVLNVLRGVQFIVSTQKMPGGNDCIPAL
jgi:hypothetical protein